MSWLFAHLPWVTHARERAHPLVCPNPSAQSFYHNTGPRLSLRGNIGRDPPVGGKSTTAGQASPGCHLPRRCAFRVQARPSEPNRSAADRLVGIRYGVNSAKAEIGL